MQSHSIEETNVLAASFLESLTPTQERATVVGLKGDLGAGKTTFVKGVAAALGVEHTITSPTFVIEKIYKVTHAHFKHLIHIDAYRLESGEELQTLGWGDITSDPHNLILIEWPERVQNILPEGARTIQFEFVDETTRNIILL